MNQVGATIKASRMVYLSSIVLLCLWILGPLYLLAVNALSSPETINQFPMSLIPEFDLESLIFFLKFNGMIDALINRECACVGHETVGWFNAVTPGEGTRHPD